jgi:nucleotide-binding universal stress UspA family protein
MRRLLDEALADLEPSDTPIQFDVVEGYPSNVLIDTARRSQVDLVVTGSRGHGGMVGLLLGSVSQDLAVRSPKPLVIVPALSPDWNASGPVVVGVDGSAHADEALRWAIAEAAAHGTTVRAVTAWSTRTISIPPKYVGRSAEVMAEEAVAILRDAVTRVAGQDPGGGAANVDQTTAEGGPAPVLLDAAQDASMLVVGRRGLGAVRGRLMGSTSHALAHRSQVPTVIIPGLADEPEPSAER